MNKPKKYRENFGDRLIQNSLDALKYCQTANIIFMNENTKEKDYLSRRAYLQKALGIVDNISTIADIFLELNYNLDGANQEQIDRQEEHIGSACRQIHNLIKGVLKSDESIFKGIKRFRT